MTSFLLNDRLAPITSNFGFVECDLETTVEWFFKWSSAIQRDRGVLLTKRAAVGSLEKKLRALVPLTSVEARRFLFLPTRSKWTACFDSGWQGADGAWLSVAALDLKARAIRAVAIPDSMGTRPGQAKKGRLGGTIFELYGPDETSFLNCERSIGAPRTIWRSSRLSRCALEMG